MHSTTCALAQLKSYTYNTSDDLFQRGLCLPSGTNMSDEEINRAVLAVKKLYAK